MASTQTTGVNNAATTDDDNKNNDQKQKIVICGGGNAAHIWFGFAASHPNNDVYLLSLFRTEAADFKAKTIQNSNKLILDVTQKNSKIEVNVKPENVTNDPSCLKNADIVIISLPAFAHNQYLCEIAKNVGDKECLVGVFPGAAGLECEWKSIITNINSCKFGQKYTLLSSVTLPWACRLKDFGVCAEILGTKDSLRVSLYPAYDTKYITAINEIIGALPVISNYGPVINMSLGNTNAICHPPLMYDKWSNWDGKPVDKKPLFYHGLTKNGAKLVSSLSSETMLIAEYIRKETNINTIAVTHIYEADKKVYGDKCADTSSLWALWTTNPAYNGLTHPMVVYKDKNVVNDNDQKQQYVPNFKYRYLTEDIPYGLVVIKGIALLLKNVPKTPNIDLIIKWAQKVMNKEYLIYNDNNGTVTAGKDINETRAPQRYNFKNIQELM